MQSRGAAGGGAAGLELAEMVVLARDTSSQKGARNPCNRFTSSLAMRCAKCMAVLSAAFKLPPKRTCFVIS
jgi:hypothetical protein